MCMCVGGEGRGGVSVCVCVCVSVSGGVSVCMCVRECECEDEWWCGLKGGGAFVTVCRLLNNKVCSSYNTYTACSLLVQHFNVYTIKLHQSVSYIYT